MPSYPFERKRYWIDPPAKKTELQAPGIKSLSSFERSSINTGQIKMAPQVQANLTDENMMYFLLQQMQTNQQLITMMMAENTEI